MSGEPVLPFRHSSASSAPSAPIRALGNIETAALANLVNHVADIETCRGGFRPLTRAFQNSCEHRFRIILDDYNNGTITWFRAIRNLVRLLRDLCRWVEVPSEPSDGV